MQRLRQKQLAENGLINAFGTTVRNANHINAKAQPLPEVAAEPREALAVGNRLQRLIGRRHSSLDYSRTLANLSRAAILRGVRYSLWLVSDNVIHE